MVEVENVYKKYMGNDYYSVNNVKFSVERGNIFGLLGHNGAGKTTMMKMLNTVLRSDKGSIVINGIDLNQNPIEVKKYISTVFEVPRLYENLTGEENIIFYASLFGISKNIVLNRVEEMYKDLQVDFQKKYVKDYSKGMKQKISIIRALIVEPKLILMDEPTSGLDIVARKLIRRYIYNLKLKNKTIILTSHVAEDIEKLCDKVIIMSKGELIEYGTIEKLKKKYNKNSFEEVYIKILNK